MFLIRKKQKMQSNECAKSISKDSLTKKSLSIYHEHRANNRSNDQQEFESLGSQTQQKINLPPITQPSHNEIQEEQCKTFEPDDAEINFLGLNQLQQNEQNQNQQFNLPQANQQFVQVKIKPIYNFGKLHTNTTQMLPMIMKVKSSKQANQRLTLNSNITIALDNNINLNNLDMIQMKRCFQQLINSLSNYQQVTLLLQERVFKLKENLIMKFIEKLHPQHNDSMSIKNIFQKLNTLRVSDQENNKIILIYQYQDGFTSQIYKKIIQHFHNCYFYLLEFGNQNNLFIQGLKNAAYFQINKYEDILDVIEKLNGKDSQIDCTIKMKCLSINNAGQVTLKDIYHNINPEGNQQFEISIKNLPSNFTNYYAFEIILPKVGLNYKYQQQIDILDAYVCVKFINQNTAQHERQTISLNIVQNHLVIPSDSLNVNAAVLFYRYLTYYQLSQNRIKQQVQVNWIKNCLLEQLTRNQQILDRTQDLQQLIIQFRNQQ